MKFSVLKLQKYSFIVFTVFTFLLFVATIVFSTSYYNTYLYGNEELVSFYTTELQEYNQMIFIFSIILVILFVIGWILKPKKYYPTLITFPIFLSILLVGIVFGIIIMVRMQDITGFYSSYDYTGLSKLEGFKGNMFFPIFLGFSSIGLAIVNILSIVVYSFGFWKYIKGRGEAHA